MMTENKDHGGRYANVNGLKMYYEVHGTGKPLVLLRGTMSTIAIDSDLAQRRR